MIEKDLDKVITQMKALHEADTELAHIQADQLLIQTLSLIADDNGLSEKIETLITEYNLIEKWFA